jgi:hypothetical protein
MPKWVGNDEQEEDDGARKVGSGQVRSADGGLAPKEIGASRWIGIGQVGWFAAEESRSDAAESERDSRAGW